jgi:hypothetical protein
MKHTAQKLILSLFSLALLSLIAYHVLHITVLAQSNSNIMTVIPPRLEISAKPGETIRKIVQFRNESDSTAYLAVSVKDFIVNNNTGQPDFVDARVSGRWAASSWIKTNSSLNVPPKIIANLNVTINVPNDALPGGHYAGILYQNKGTASVIGKGVGAGSAITQVVGTLVYINVAGPINENATVRKFEVPGFSEYGPIPFNTEINNLSDTHIKPVGQITIRNLFGNVATRLKLDERNVFPGASLLYANTWQEKLLIGRFRADLEVAYGSGRALKATAYFWVFPWKVALIVILTIILIGLIAYLISKKIKSRQEELEDKLAEEEKEISELKKELKKD